MANVTSIQIGQNIIAFTPQCDYANKATLNAPFTLQTRGNDSFYISTFTPTEDCYLSFQGTMTDSENQFYVVNVTDDCNILSVHLDKIHLNWNYFMQPIFIKKGKTIEFRVRGFTGAKIWKWGLI